MITFIQYHEDCMQTFSLHKKIQKPFSKLPKTNDNLSELYKH